jgi:cation diffusion facilitator family transporter
MTPSRLMTVSIAVALLTICLKAGAWWITGSVGLLSDALESFVNLAAAVFGLCMVAVAARPADDEHPFGHGKAEYFSSGFEGVLIIGAAAAILLTAVPRFWHPRPLEQMGWGLALSVCSSALNGGLAWAMLRASRVHSSIALEADARHLLTDVWTSAGVVVGLALVTVSGWLWLDPLVAVAVALNIVREGARLIWRSSQGLMDERVEPAVRARVQAVLERFETAANDRGEPGAAAAATVRFDHVLTRRAGQYDFLNLHLHLPAAWSLGRAAALRAEVEQALTAAVPRLRVSIQMLPLGVEPPIDRAPAPAPVRAEVAPDGR